MFAHFHTAVFLIVLLCVLLRVFLFGFVVVSLVRERGEGERRGEDRHAREYKEFFDQFAFHWLSSFHRYYEIRLVGRDHEPPATSKEQ
jgi:hypothetical protein